MRQEADDVVSHDQNADQLGEMAPCSNRNRGGTGQTKNSRRKPRPRLRASTEIHSWWLVFFTVVLVVLTIVLAGLTFVLALAAAHELHWITS
jgi:ABC-type Fe3+ transport system permease subunit